MSNVIISLEATCDLSKDIIAKHNFRVVDMDFLIDGEVYSTANDTVTSTNLYPKMREGVKTSTSQVNESIYEEHFTKLLEEGKDILHLAFSSGLSCTYQSACAAAEKVNATSKNKVYVVDTLCACSGHGLLAIYVDRYAKSAKSMEQLITYTNNIKMSLNHCFTVDNLKYLAQGGRIKNSTAIIGNMLNVKPVMRANDEGKLENVQKVFSRKKALATLASDMKKKYDPQYDVCFIAHADCEADALFTKELIEKETSANVIIQNLGPVIGCHSGPGTLAIFYMADKR